jgi:hypothetical protein
MPEMQDIDDVGALANTVVDYDRSVDQLADTWTSFHWTADVWETLQDVHVVQNSIAKPFGGCGKLRPGIRQDFFKIR